MRLRTSSFVLAALFLLLPATAAAQPFGGFGGGGGDADTVALSAMDARSIGPAAMSGRIGDVEGVRGTTDTIFVGAATGGVWKSVDGGTTWEPIFDDQPSLSIGELEVHPKYHDVIWVGTGEDNPRNSVGIGQGVFRSIDGGETWSDVGLENSEHIAEIVAHPEKPEVAWVAATGPLWNGGEQRGVYKTTDGGETWELVLEPINATSGAADLALDPDNPDKLIATMWQRRRWPHFFKSGGPGSAMYVSHDGGESWDQVTEEDGLPEGPLGKINVAIAPSNPEIVYALVEAENTALYRSEDGGESWDAVNRSEGMADRPFYYNRVQVDPENPDRVYHIAGDLRVSDDGGRSFRTLAGWNDGVHVDHHAVWISPSDPSYIVDSNDGGVYISRDRGGSWRFVENLPLSQFYEISVDDTVPYHVYGGLQDNGSWQGPAEAWSQGGLRNFQWTEVGFGDGFSAFRDPNDPRYGWTTSQGGSITRYDLETGERRGIRPAPPADSIELRYNWNAPITVSPHDGNTIYQGAQYVYRSTDDGMSWERISPDLTTDSTAWQQQEKSGGLTLDVTGAENYTTVYTIAVSPVEQGVIWAGTDDGNVQVTRDGGETWTNVQGNMPDKPRHSWVSHIEASKHRAGAAYAAVHDYMRGDWTTYVYRTTNYGQSWTRLPTGDVDGFARTVLEDPENPNLLWVGTEFGLFYSLDRGQSWEEWSHGFPSGVPVRALATQTQEHEQDLVVATYGRGAYVVDDLTPLRAMADDPSLLHADLHVFEPGPAIEHVVAPPKVYRFDGSAMFRGENEEYGATVTIAAHVPDSLAGGGSRMEAGAGGQEAEYPYTQVESAPDTTPPVPTKEATFQVLSGDSLIQESDLTLEEGLNRHTWRFDTQGAASFPRSMQELQRALESPEEQEERDGFGPPALPGSYTIRVVSHGDTATADLEVQGDPRIATPMSELREKRDYMYEAADLQQAATGAVETLRMARIRVNRALDLLADQEGLPESEADSLRQAGQTVIDSLKAAEDQWTGDLDTGGETSTEPVMDRIPGGFFMSPWHAPTQPQLQRLEYARQAIPDAIERTNRVLETDVADFRQRILDAGLELIPPVEPVPMPGSGGM